MTMLCAADATWSLAGVDAVVRMRLGKLVHRAGKLYLDLETP